jgi:hypothetical protein
VEIGEEVLYQGRSYVLRGIDPMSVDGRRAEIEDPETGERIWVPASELSDA